MPNGYYSPYQDAAQAFSGVGNSLNDIVVGLAQQRHQQAQLREQRRVQYEQFQQEHALKKLQFQQNATLNKQREALYESQRGLNDQKQIGLANDQNTGQQMGNTLEAMVAARNNPNAPHVPEYLLANLSNQSGRLAASGTRFVPENVAPILGLGNERERMMLSTGTKPQQSRPIEHNGIDIISGLIEELGAAKLNRGQDLVDLESGTRIASGQPFPPSMGGQAGQKMSLNTAASIRSDPSKYLMLPPMWKAAIDAALTNQTQQVTGPVPVRAPAQATRLS